MSWQSPYPSLHELLSRPQVPMWLLQKPPIQPVEWEERTPLSLRPFPRWPRLRTPYDIIWDNLGSYRAYGHFVSKPVSERRVRVCEEP